MAQTHPFVNPFFMPRSENNAFSNHWLELEQKCWHDYWKWISWQQNTLQQNYQDTLKVMTHMIQLSPQPSHLYRYYRLNWQKPYINLSAQAITSMRLLSKLMIQNWCAWQAMMAPEKN